MPECLSQTASQKEVPGGIGGNPNFGTTMHRQSKAKHTASQVDAPSRVVENPYSEAALRGQNKTIEKEYTTKMSHSHDFFVDIKKNNPAIIIRGLAESNSDIASERIQLTLSNTSRISN